MRLHAFDDDVGEAEVFEFAGERADLAEGLDDPALGESAKDGLLRAAQFAGAEEAVCDDEAAARAQKAVCFAEKCGFICASGVATALDGTDGVQGFGWQRCVFVVAERELDAPTFGAGLIELMALLELPWYEGDSV